MVSIYQGYPLEWWLYTYDTYILIDLYTYILIYLLDRMAQVDSDEPGAIKSWLDQLPGLGADAR